MGPFSDLPSVPDQAPESPLEVLTRYALEALTWHWGEAYAITVTDDGQWQARRADGLGAPLEADTPEELRQAILDDYWAHPVPREHEPVPAQGTAYTRGGPLDGKPVNERRARSFPATAHCAGCGHMLSRASQGEPWEHDGRMPGES